MVLLEGAWAKKGTPSEDLPDLTFRVSHGWVKQTLQDFTNDFLNELRIIATLHITRCHYRFLTSPNSLARAGFLVVEKFRRLEKTKYPNNLSEAIEDLSAPNKRNRGIQEGINKAIYLVVDIIPGAQVLQTMPSTPYIP